MKRNISIAKKAARALHDAMANVVAENRRFGLPVILWRNGKVVRVPAGKVKAPRASR